MKKKKATLSIGVIAAPVAVMCAGALLLVLTLVSGCGGQANQSLATDVKFPGFVYRSEDSLKGYNIAVSYPEVLQYVPCYCGCKQDAGKYQSLKDCFIDRRTGEYDEHAAGCAICLEEAIDVGRWKQEGLSTREIRERIDANYAERGEPTETPMPPE